MSATIINIIIQVIVGTVAGNATGVAFKEYDLGKFGNTITGAIGGIAGGQILTALLPMLAETAENVDISAQFGARLASKVYMMRRPIKRAAP